MKKSYQRGELSAYFGVSPDTLRHYESMGILSPQRNDSGYRTYSREDMLYLDYAIRLKNLGVPLKEIARLAKDGSLEQAEQLLDRQCDELLTRMEELDALYRAARNTRSLFASTRESLNRISVCQAPRMILSPVDASLSEAMDTLRALDRGLASWFCALSDKSTPFAGSYKRDIADSGIRLGNARYAVAAIDLEGSITIPPRLAGKLVDIPPRRCLHTAVLTNPGVNYAPIVRFIDYIDQHALIAADDILTLFISLRNGRDPGEDYYQIFVPLE